MIEQHLLDIKVTKYKKGSKIPRNPATMQTDFSLSESKKTLAFLLKETVQLPKRGCDANLSHTDFTLTSPEKVEKLTSTGELEKVCSVYLTPSHIELNTEDALYTTFKARDFYIRMDAILGKGFPYSKMVSPANSSPGTPTAEATPQPQQSETPPIVAKHSEQKMVQPKKPKSRKLFPSHTFEVKSCTPDGDIFMPLDVLRIYEKKKIKECIIYRTTDGGYNVLTEKKWEQVLAYIEAKDKNSSLAERRKKMRAFFHHRSSPAYIVGDYIIPATETMKEHIRTSKEFTVQVYC